MEKGHQEMTPSEDKLLRAMGRKIREAEMELGALTRGQKCDLLLDNFSQIVDSEHAAYVLAAIEDFDY